MHARLGAVLCVAYLLSTLGLASCAAPMELPPAMKPVVTCVYDMMRAHPGTLLVEVYAVDHTKYLIEYTFRSKNGAKMTGDIVVYDGVEDNGNYAYGNENDHGESKADSSEEVEFFGDISDAIVLKCHVFPTFMDLVRFPGAPVAPDPALQRVEMSTPPN